MANKLTAVQQKELDRMQKQFVAMAQAGIGLIERYGAGRLEKAESEVLSAMGAALFASYFSSQSNLAQKKTAIGIALRAAFTYGQECGKTAVYNDGQGDSGDGNGADAATPTG